MRFSPRARQAGPVNICADPAGITRGTDWEARGVRSLSQARVRHDKHAALLFSDFINRDPEIRLLIAAACGMHSREGRFSLAQGPSPLG